MKTKQIKDVIRALSEFEIILKKYKIGNRTIISIKDLELLSIDGHEYMVFKYKDQVVKIHRKNFCSINSLDEKNILSFIDIPTKRILMPTESLYNIDGTIAGYVMDLVRDKKSIAHESMDHFLNEASILESDKKILDEEGILLQDLHEGNAIYNGGIYIVDSGRYINTNIMLPTHMNLIDKLLMTSKEELQDLKQKVIRMNTSQLNTFLYKFIMNVVLDCFNDNEKHVYFYIMSIYFKTLAEEMGTSSYFEVIEKKCDRNMTVEEYAKSLKKYVDFNL